MPTRGFNFDTLPTCDSHRYCAVTQLSSFCYSNTENVKNKTPNGSKHSHSNLEHEEHVEHTQNSKTKPKSFFFPSDFTLFSCPTISFSDFPSLYNPTHSLVFISRIVRYQTKFQRYTSHQSRREQYI